MSNKYQPDISFKSIEEFLDTLPENELRIVNLLRDTILDTLPHCHEKLSYSVPFYSLKKRICYIWPGSIPWGRVHEGVTMGFHYGSQLSNDDGYLEKGGRKSVYTKTFSQVGNIDIGKIAALLLESEQLDRE